MEDQTQLIDLDKPVQNNDHTVESVLLSANSTNKLFKISSAESNMNPLKQPELSATDKGYEDKEVHNITGENDSCSPRENETAKMSGNMSSITPKRQEEFHADRLEHISNVETQQKELDTNVDNQPSFVFDDVINHDDFLQLSRRNIDNSLFYMSKVRQRLCKSDRTEIELPSLDDLKDSLPEREVSDVLSKHSNQDLTGLVKDNGELEDIEGDNQYHQSKTSEWQVETSRSHNNLNVNSNFDSQPSQQKREPKCKFKTKHNSSSGYKTQCTKQPPFQPWHRRHSCPPSQSAYRNKEITNTLPDIHTASGGCHRFTRKHDTSFFRPVHHNYSSASHPLPPPSRSRHDMFGETKTGRLQNGFCGRSSQSAPSSPLSSSSLPVSKAFDPVDLHFDSLFRLIRRSMCSFSMPAVPIESSDSTKGDR